MLEKAVLMSDETLDQDAWVERLEVKPSAVGPYHVQLTARKKGKSPITVELPIAELTKAISHATGLSIIVPGVE